MKSLMLLMGLVGASLVGCGVDDVPAQINPNPDSNPDAQWGDFAVTIVQPPGHGKLNTGLFEITGEPAAIPCATCHEAGAAESIVSREGAPKGDEIHDHINLIHGNLVCESCHAPGDPTKLRLASGEIFTMDASMKLCGQCHGPQLTNYEHGAHGGMRGYWDLTRGPRERNDCVACHSAHAPAYPKVIPAAAPKDRFIHPQHRPGSMIDARFGEVKHE